MTAFSNDANRILLDGELYATVEPGQAGMAVKLLNDARYKNANRKYSAAARLIAKADALPGFKLAHPFDEAGSASRLCVCGEEGCPDD